MGNRIENSMFCFLIFVFILLISFCHSQSIIKTLPGYEGDLPFKLETGYVGIGKNEEVQLFYYFVESERNPEEDPIILYIPGGPGVSGLPSFAFGREGPLRFSQENGLNLNPNSWTKMASMIFVDVVAGIGFSYAKTKEAWISSDSIMSNQANEFIKKFLVKHPTFLKNPLYIAGISYVGIIVPVITLQLYEGNLRGDQPSINIQGYILCSPLTDKFTDFNSRLEYAYRMALISNDIFKSAIENCDGNYIHLDTPNSLCSHSLQRYQQCTDQLNIENILVPPCKELDPMPYCFKYCDRILHIWANSEVVQQALNIDEGTIGTWESMNTTMHYTQEKNDTFCYAYDIFSSVSYHRKLASKHCRALIYSGDHDMTFPYVGIERWIASLNIRVEIPWSPFYVDGQVGGYEITYAQHNFSLTFATIKGSGHSVPVFKPKESTDVVSRWLAS